LAIISLLTGSAIAALIISVMVIFGGLLRFSQEFKSNKAAEKLREMGIGSMSRGNRKKEGKQGRRNTVK